MDTTTTDAPAAPRQRLLLGIIAAVVVLAALVGVTGFLLGRNGPDAEQATVVRLSSDGDSLCVDTRGGSSADSCGQPVIRPDDRAKVRPGAEITMARIWVTQGDSRRLVFVVNEVG